MKKFTSTTRATRILIAVHLFGFCAAVPALATESESQDWLSPEPSAADASPRSAAPPISSTQISTPVNPGARPPVRRARRVAGDPRITTQTTTRDLPVEEEQTGTALAIFLGAGGSYYSVLPNNSVSVETQKAGMGYQGKVGLNFYNRSLALELGAGWMQSSVSSTAPKTTTVGNTVSVTQAQVETKVGIFEFSPRIRLGEHFEIGPSAGVLFGTNASFGATTSQPDSPIVAGVKAAAMWQTKFLHFRAVAQAQTTLSIPERSVIMGGLGLEIGLPLLRGKTVVRETETREIRERETVEYVETEVPVIQKVEVVKEVLREVVLFSFDDQVVHFEFDHAEVASGSRPFVERLGRYLASHRDQWSGLKIVGHTDSRGSAEYNLKLSADRAETVRSMFASSGVPADRMVSRGLGLSSPIDRGPSDLSRARNRRVELNFTGVKDARVIQDAINRIRFETTTPRTCKDGLCR